jgi:transposase
MNPMAYREFFLEPAETWHRRYEALRACFVELQPLAEVARRFGVSYGTVCNWVSQFRSEQDAGQRPPFFCSRRAGAR